MTDAAAVLAPFIGAVTAGRTRVALPAPQVLALVGARQEPPASAFVHAHPPT